MDGTPVSLALSLNDLSHGGSHWKLHEGARSRGQVGPRVLERRVWAESSAGPCDWRVPGVVVELFLQLAQEPHPGEGPTMPASLPPDAAMQAYITERVTAADDISLLSRGLLKDGLVDKFALTSEQRRELDENARYKTLVKAWIQEAVVGASSSSGAAHTA